MNIINKLFTQKITITEENQKILLTIKESLSIKEYTTILKKSKYSRLLNIISLKHILQKDYITPKKILIIEKNNITYIISYTNTSILLTKKTQDTNIIEETINIDKINYTYQISRLIHTQDGNTIDTKIYNKDQTKNYSFFLLPKKEALKIASTILEELSTIEELYKCISIKEILNILNITLNKDYYPLINNERITLSWPNRYGQNNIKTKIRTSLDILLNETREKIGEISFNYMYNPKTSYTGNISYKIIPEYQNMHYATEALSLLKEILKEHQNSQSKDLYISVDINNIRSQKVALNNGGELYYEGEIPRSESLSKHSGISHIKMYKIKID